MQCSDHAQLIEAAYDCVDRLVVNGYYPLGQAGGGFRTFWRQWKGNDSGLSGQALRQAAGDLARRLKAYCRQQGILWMECGAGDLKYQIAREHRPKDPAFVGVFAVLVGRAPAPLWEVRRNGQGQITELRRTEQWPHVQHYYFQIIDPEWGHGVVRLWPPSGGCPSRWRTSSITLQRFQSVSPNLRSHSSCEAQSGAAAALIGSGSKRSTWAAQARANR